jgi:hypothetical protein
VTVVGLPFATHVESNPGGAQCHYRSDDKSVCLLDELTAFSSPSPTLTTSTSSSSMGKFSVQAIILPLPLHSRVCDETMVKGLIEKLSCWLGVYASQVLVSEDARCGYCDDTSCRFYDLTGLYVKQPSETVYRSE